MKKKRRSICVLVPFTLFLVWAASTVSAQEAFFPFEVKHFNGIAYITGGIGFDERRELARLGKDYSLKLVFARTGGAYVAMVDVEIKNAKGEAIFTAKSRGPWFLLDLPAGSYTVKVTAQGQTLREEVTVVGKPQTEKRFYW